jgi:phytoene synthase
MKSRLLIKNLSLEKVYFEDLISGQLMDENFSQPLNISDFNLYCYRVAGVVGIMMSKIFRTQKSPIALNAAEKLGSAMQITNILRDVKEDFEKKRVYIPISLFQKHKIENSLEFFSSDINKQNKIEIIKDLSNIAILYYCESLEGIKYIPSFRARLCVKLMVAVYGSILGKILIDKSFIFKKRIVISHFKKMIIFLKVVIGFHPLKVAKLISKEELP